MQAEDIKQEPIFFAAYPIREDGDIVLIRQQAQRLAEALGYERQDRMRIATAVSEIVRNALQHGGGGKISFGLASSGTSPRLSSAGMSKPEEEAGEMAQCLVAEITDRGPGIPRLDEVLQGRDPVGSFGLTAARRLMDRVEIDSAPGTGTRVRLIKNLAARNAAPDQDLATLAANLSASLAAGLSDHPSGEPLAQIQHLNRELALCLDDLRSRQEEMERLGAELEDTNRGVVALYSELDDKAEQLKQASELKSRFLSNMGHEFRTPLNSILALSSLLLDGFDGALDAEQARQVTYIRQAAEGLTELVNDLLDLAKVESGKVDLRPCDFTVHELFGGLRGMLKPLSLNDAVKLIFDEGVNLPVLHSDMGKISQILRNFISNALKFTEHGEVRVTARQAPDGRIEFAVRDTGIGIAPEYHQAVFDEFLQVENPLQARHKGTGLGLPLSKKLAELLGGEVRLESALGQGSTFTLHLPRAAVQSAPAAGTVPGAGPQNPVTAGKSILIIDDEEAFRYVLRQLISTSDCRLLETNDGAAGLDLIRAQRPDAVFLDLQMPALNGYQVLEMLKSDASLKDIPVIICTSSVLGPADHARLAGAMDILPKHDLSRAKVSALLRAIGLDMGNAHGR